VVFEPNVFINDFDGLIVASSHGSPWRYDSYVPVMFAGAGIEAQKVSRAITPYDVAATLSAYLGVKPPSAAIGHPLPEVLIQHMPTHLSASLSRRERNPSLHGSLLSECGVSEVAA
jgi:arylsulfatase A-like enzyme